MFSLNGTKAPVFFLAFFCLLLCQGLDPQPAKATKEGMSKQDLVPASILRWPEDGADHAILVDKSLQKIFVYHRDDLSRPVKTFDCSTGENDGPKYKVNDRRTPEGVYFFTGSYDKKDLSPIYGVKAFPIDYPNPMDKKEGKNGYGIWFHGLNKPLKPRDTNGCIALENGDLEELASFIDIGDTPVIITSKIEMADAEEVEEEAEALLKTLEDWRQAWEAKEIDKYMSFYNSQFSSSSMDWHQWKQYKHRLAKKYGGINVGIDNISLFKNDGLVLSMFNQKYGTGGFHSEGEKSLFLRQNSKEWKILGEFFKAPDKGQISIKKRPPSPLEGIKDFLKIWEKAWEEQDLEAYISFYDPDFNSRGMDLNEWKDHRSLLNEKHRSVQIEISGLKIKQASGDMAKVGFKQEYQADDYRDVGHKDLLLIKRGKAWKINKEEWRPLSRGFRR
ncbi:MAG: L,D-transpeptidase family protein [Desulfobacterales bacterium]|nr:L,D-transpeptidase family protein [Desulfobacterales bacterium]